MAFSGREEECQQLRDMVGDLEKKLKSSKSGQTKEIGNLKKQVRERIAENKNLRE